MVIAAKGRAWPKNARLLIRERISSIECDEHFGIDPAKLVLVTQRYAAYNNPIFISRLEQLLSQKKVKAELEGIIPVQSYEAVSLAKLSRKNTSHLFLPGPVEYQDVEVANGAGWRACRRGIYWVKTKRDAIVMLVSEAVHQFPPGIMVEVMGVTREAAEDFGASLSVRVSQSAAFRGHVLSLELDCHHQMSVRFHRLPQISRQELILPGEVLKRLDRQTMGIVLHAERFARRAAI